MKKFLAVLLAALLLCGVLAGCGGNGGSGDNSLQYVKDKGTLILGLDDAFPPMGFTDENGDIVGFDIDVAKAVAEELGVKLVLQPVDWEGNESELNSKNVDCLWNGLSVTPTRLEKLTMTKSYMKNRLVIIVKSDSGINSLSDLSGKVLGTQGGNDAAATALDNKADFKNSLGNIVEFKDYNMAFQDLKIGGVDAVLVDEVVGRYYLTNSGENCKVLDEILDDSDKYAVGLRKGDESLKNAIDEAFVKLQKDGTLKKISEKWFGEDIINIE